jgi:serine protease
VKAGANIINMSLGGPSYSTFQFESFKHFYEFSGVLLIAAAGNDGDSAYSYPASYPSVVGVGAVDSGNQHASFSQTNDQVELSAPGVAVGSTYPNGRYVSFLSILVSLFVSVACICETMLATSSNQRHFAAWE